MFEAVKVALGAVGLVWVLTARDRVASVRVCGMMVLVNR